MEISVILPTRNRSALLAMALCSVLRQQDTDLEVIVVDEASTDATMTFLANCRDNRVRVIRHATPLGVSAARNHGALEARGDWLAFIDDDDLWAPDKLARQLHAARTAGGDWVYCGSVNMTDRGRIVSGFPPLPPDDVVAALLRYNAIPGGGSNVIVRRTAWLSAGPFDTRLKNTEDWEMWIRLAKQGKPAWVCSPLLGYRVHATNSSLDIEEILRGTRLIEVLHHTTVDWGRIHRWLAESCLRQGNRRAAVGQFARAAVRGQMRGVVSDARAIVRRSLARRIGGLESERIAATDSWTASAAWLPDFYSSR